MSMHMRIVSMLVGLGASFALAGPASAQPTASADLQHFSLNGDVNSFAYVRSARIAPKMRPSFGLVFNYAHRLLQNANVNPGQVTRTSGGVGGILAGQARAAFAFTDWVEVGVQMPFLEVVNFDQDFSGFTSGSAGVGAGDLRLEGRFLPLREDQLFGLEIAPFVTFPTGGRNLYLSSGVPTFGLLVNASKHWKFFHVAGHVGYQLKPGFAVIANTFASDDMVHYGVGAGISPVPDILDVNVELAGMGYVGPGRKTLRNSVAKTYIHAPLELYVDARIKTPIGLSILVGGGPGMTPAVGTPAFRVFAGVGFAPKGGGDKDGDGIADSRDQCIDEPEDKDSFEDTDGCPDPDNDGDGILDADDACPDKPEDADGFEDGDGCPDPDNDGDGVLDVDDRCPDTKGDKANAGCPSQDRDGDGVSDADDQCPDEPEDKDGWEDTDGCPDPDNDGDGVLDADDLCPDQPENVNKFKDEDGCPDEIKTVVRGSKIVILDKVLFFTNKATIKPESKGILEAVKQTLIDNPQLKKVRVEGHTDSDGSDEYNQDLSERRAQAIVDGCGSASATAGHEALATRGSSLAA
jgi:outer membrane protein OmpA-like peptidoglycan-associated protein